MFEYAPAGRPEVVTALLQQIVLVNVRKESWRNEVVCSVVYLSSKGNDDPSHLGILAIELK